MRKWQDLAPQNDPNSWSSARVVWPTNRGTYETADVLSANSYAATGASAPSYAWCALPTSSSTQIEYVVDAAHIWQFDGSALTDRTGGVSIGSAPQMAQFGDVTIAVMGNAVATVKSTSPGTNFSALAGAPKGASICVQSNAALIFNTDTSADGWAASDVGDYTNWSTGESASGRIYQTPGPIMAAIPFGNDVLVFKTYSIYRMTYVGGLVKWQVQLAWHGVGCGNANQACAGHTGVLFSGISNADTGSPTTAWYWFDGINPPRIVNPLTTIPAGKVVYNPLKDVFTIWPSTSQNTTCYYYSPATGAWGQNEVGTGGATAAAVPVEGGFSGRRLLSSTTATWRLQTTNTLASYNAITNSGWTSYLTTSKFGKPDRKTQWGGLIPVYRRTPSGTIAAYIATYRELHDTSNQAVFTATQVTNPVTRNIYTVPSQSGGNVDNYATLQLTTTGDFEIDDILPYQPVDVGPG